MMSTLIDVEKAATELSIADRQRLLLTLAASLRSAGGSMPEPRQFSEAEIRSWIDEDERDFQEFKKGHG